MHLYIRQTTPPSSHESSQTQKWPTVNGGGGKSPFSACIFLLTVKRVFNKKVPCMWLRPLLDLFLLAAGLGFFVVLSFLLLALHGKNTSGDSQKAFIDILNENGIIRGIF